MTIEQGLGAVVAPDARLLILGSFPGRASLDAARYYAHARNAFWPILGHLLGEPLAQMPYEERLLRVMARRIAIWDSCSTCRRSGSLDSAMREISLNDFSMLFSMAPGIEAVAFNGRQAEKLARNALPDRLSRYVLPSTSPAYASRTLLQKLDDWSVLREEGWI